MKRTILLLVFSLAIWWQGNAQAVNEPANWPNTAWTLDTIAHTGSNPMDIEANPTVDDHFAFDDDDTGSGSHDELAAESPVIDLTSAFNAGETNIFIEGEYVYNNASSSEKLAIQYWDADNNSWEDIYVFPNEDTDSAPTDNYCSGTAVSYQAILDISGFTDTQLSGFKYRIYYNDNTSSSDGWRWGFCFSSPTLYSAGYTPPEISVTINPDCDNDQFSVDVKITDMGGSSSITISDDQGSATQQVSDTSTVVTFGPYPNTTEVVITATSDDDSTVSSSETVQYFCPPDNDQCADAIELTVETDCNDPVIAYNNNATDSGVESPGCANYQGGDIWFYVTASQDIDTLIFETKRVSGSDFTDSGMAVYTGDCNNLTLVQCDDDGGESTMSKVTVDNVAAGTTYYVRVWEYGNNSFGEVGVCAYAPNLSANNSLTADEFTFYPNPTNGTISWNAKGNIDRVQITNMAGQVLISLDNPQTDHLNISRLSNGIYLLNVWMDGKKGVYRIIKK
ncbi:MAG: T9SS type A sorting domain-containing protein [Chlorobi bacterium]|nr:T9SS type A sorting domain-containing protein [Chlorobiota bacterium]